MALLLMDQALVRPLYHDLINKAAQNNASLTEAERQQLLHLPNPQNPLYGKALAYPETITPGERLEILGWPSEDVRRANITFVTDGTVQDPDEFLARAAEDVSWMSLAHVKLILNEFHIADDEVGEYKNMVRYRCTVAPARLRFRSHEKASAQRLIMTETERTAYHNATDAYHLGTAVEKRKAKLQAGELDSQAAKRELQIHRQARKQYSEDIRKQDRSLVPRPPLWGLPPYFPPQSDQDLYLIYYAERDKQWAKDMVENKTEYGFTVYRTKQIRVAHEVVPAELYRDAAMFIYRDLLKRALINKLYRVEDAMPSASADVDAGLRNSFNTPPVLSELLSGGAAAVPFDEFWTAYLHDMMPRATPDGHAGRASPGPKRRMPMHESDLAKQVRYQAVGVGDIEVSEDDPEMDKTLRRHFKSHLASSPSPGISTRYFMVCTSDGTPSIVDAFKSSTKVTVWVYDADWKALNQGGTMDDDLDDASHGWRSSTGYLGKIKVRLLHIESLPSLSSKPLLR